MNNESKRFMVGERVLVTLQESQFFGKYGTVQEENTGSYRVELEGPTPLLRFFSPDQIDKAATQGDEVTEPMINYNLDEIGKAAAIAQATINTYEAITMTLPTDSSGRKNYPLFSGLLRYFPAALAGVANTSKLGNDKHNPGQPLHHARNKSSDHGDCVLRHLTDIEDLLAARNRGVTVQDQQILAEVNQMAWRALALAQAIHEKLGAPLAPGASQE